MKKLIKNICNNKIILLYFIVFFILSILYFYPILLSKKIIQTDIINYIGGSKEIIDYRKKFNKESYWSNSMFSGMPTYQAGAQYPLDILKYIDNILRFLPRPADYIFLFFIGFFFLGTIFIKEYEYAFLGAIIFGFSSYFYIILESGHNSKAHAIAYFAPFFSGLYILFKKNKKLGFILSTLFFALEIRSNHFQMTYYLLFIVSFFILVEFYLAIKKNKIKYFNNRCLIFLFSIFLSIGINAPRLLSTYEYSKESNRGNSESLIGNKKGLDKEYITTWSYGKLETLNLFIPNFMGGSSMNKQFEAKTLKKIVLNYFQPNQQEEIINILSNPYWGEQPGTAPAYQGCVVCLLAFITIFFIPKKYLFWIMPSIILAIMLAWGKNFMILTNFFINYFPFYDKFRSVSSFMVVPEFLTPLLVILGLYYYLNNKNNIFKKKILYFVSIIILIILIILYFFCNSLFDFINSYESKSNIPQILLQALKEDRIIIFKSDVLRTFLFCLITILFLIFELKNKISTKLLLYVIIFLSIIDLWIVNKRFLNDDNFVSSFIMNNLFPTKIEKNIINDFKKNIQIQKIYSLVNINYSLEEIKKQDSSIYRVLNTCINPFNENNTSYFHQSIGGYHAVKLRKYQEIIDRFINFETKKINLEILNMLNTKYFLLGNIYEPQIFKNLNFNGNAWFVSKLKFVKNSNEEIFFLNKINTKNEAIIQNNYNIKNNYIKDNNGFIKLIKYLPNELVYYSKAKNKQFAVFSEIFYPYGWEVYIDNIPSKYFQVNYILRGLEIPKGKHKIEFKFNPKIIEKGVIISLVSFIIFIISSIIFFKRNKL